MSEFSIVIDDEDGGSFGMLTRGQRMQLVPDWDATPEVTVCCCLRSLPKQKPAHWLHFWMTTHPVELRWAPHRGTYFSRSRVAEVREDTARWAQEAEAMRMLEASIEVRPMHWA
jgi:hypothetical protein